MSNCSNHMFCKPSKAFLLFIISNLLAMSAFGQAVPQLKAIADQHYDAAQYTEAIEFYEKIIKLDKKDNQSKYRLAQSFYRTLKHNRARRSFLNVINAEPNEYQHSSIYYYGTILKLESEFAEADSVFGYLITQPDVPDDLLELAQKQKEGCQLAINVKKQNRGFVIDELKDLNSRFHDFGAVVNQPEQTLVFVTTRNLQSKQFEGLQYDGLLPDLIQFEQRNKNWRNASTNQRFNSLNTEWSEGSGSFTNDGKSFYFTSCRSNDGSDCKVMRSNLVNGKWGRPTPLNEYINPEGFESKHPYITPMGDTLFFVSDREGGYGGSDIWMSLRGFDEGSWVPAINLGDAINTASNEITPYWSSAFNCLIFASDGHVGYGGYDLFAAKGESFFEPEIYSLGDPFNSAHDDLYFSISDSVGFVSSNRNDKKHLNLYSFKVSDERLYISLLISGESLIDSRIVSRFKSVRTLDLTTFRVEDYQGFELFDPVKRQKPKPRIIDDSLQQIEAQQRAAAIAANIAEQNARQQNQDMSVRLSDDPERLITAGFVDTSFLSKMAKSTFEKIYFEFGSIGLTNEAKLSLNSLTEQLKNYPGELQYIHVVANTDDVGTDQYNLELSINRGISIRNYLVSRGYPASKVVVSAKGEAELISQGTTWYERLFNRRAEVNLYGESPIELRKSRKLVVRQDMSLRRAAGLLNISMDKLRLWNELEKDVLTKGQLIRINQPFITSAVKYFLDETDIRYNFFPYIIREGETLRSIAKKFGTPEELLAEINQIEGEIHPGDELFVYKLNF